MATPNWVGGCGVSTARKNPFSDNNRGQSQQEELGGDGGEKGEALGFFSLSLKSESGSSFVFIAVFGYCVSA